MACESFLVIGGTTRSAAASITCDFPDAMAAKLVQFYGLGVPCSSLLDPPTFNAAIFGTQLHMAGSPVINIADLVFGGNSTVGPFDLSVQVKPNGVALPGEILVHYDNGGVTGTTNNLGFTTIDMTGFSFIQFTMSTAGAIQNQSISYTNATGVQSVDIPGYVGCVLPACALTPTALPQLGSTVKCANFSKIFNPLGISIKGTK